MAIKRVEIEDVATHRAVEDVRQDIETLRQNPLLDAVYLKQGSAEDVSLTTGSNELYHSLGRKWRGWVVVYVTNAALIYYDEASDDVDPTKGITLQSSTNTTARLLIF